MQHHFNTGTTLTQVFFFTGGTTGVAWLRMAVYSPPPQSQTRVPIFAFPPILTIIIRAGIVDQIQRTEFVKKQKPKRPISTVLNLIFMAMMYA